MDSSRIILLSEISPHWKWPLDKAGDHFGGLTLKSLDSSRLFTESDTFNRTIIPNNL